MVKILTIISDYVTISEVFYYVIIILKIIKKYIFDTIFLKININIKEEKLTIILNILYNITLNCFKYFRYSADCF